MAKKNSHESKDFRPRHTYSPRQLYEEILKDEISLNGIYVAIRKGDIPSKRIGRKIFIPGAYVASLAEFQAEK